ncbi:MAG: hypothetical protein KDA58_15055 [Planctomycetaceae bacterium]|nr:hypothetical protein [Planctomycetaceae bacterium]
MTERLRLDILPQPDDSTCGPTCLHAVYRFFGEEYPLDQLIQETPRLQNGGTLAVLLGSHALRRGYRTTLYTYDLNVFDPTWFQSQRGVVSGAHEGDAIVPLIEKLRAQREAKDREKTQLACDAYIEFLQQGGIIRMRDLNARLIRDQLRKNVPILTGLSSTYLYQVPREFGPTCVDDDVRGEPQGHFVVLCGYDADNRTVDVADPYLKNPLGLEHHYHVGLDRLVCAILLGVLTYDANLLMIEPRANLTSPR